LERTIDDALDSQQDAKDRGERHTDTSGPFDAAGYRHSATGTASATDWRAALADRITRAGKEGQTTWSRIHRRRYAMLGVISPTRLGTLNRMAQIIDISGSVDRAALDQELIELAAMIDLLQPVSGCLILFTNTEVVSTAEVFTGQELLDLEIPKGGGTRMSAGVDFMEENGLDADVTLCFTDGYLWDDDDWKGLVNANVLVVLDRHPDSYVAAAMQRTGAEYIVASDVALAA
jgi:predicted metal-dependent peptidase